MKTSEIIKRLNDAGASVEVISIAVEALEEVRDNYMKEIALLEIRDLERRQKRAEQKRKERMSRDSRKTGDRQSQDIAATGSDPSPPDGSPPGIYNTLYTPPSLTPSPVKRAQRATRLSEDWVPKEFEGETVELEKFRDWARSAPGQKGVKADWDATWRNWMRRVREQGNVTAFPSKPKERDLRNVPDALLSNEDYWRKRRQSGR